MKFVTVILALLCALAVEADAKPQRVVVADPGCNVTFPCTGVVSSPRGERIAKKIGFGTAQKVYSGRSEIVSHPIGCPRSAFCGCGAAVRLFGKPIRDLWLAANWFRFPRTIPAPGMVAVRHHHVMVLEADLGEGIWKVYDANSGSGLTRLHARSLSGYVVVNPRGGST